MNGESETPDGARRTYPPGTPYEQIFAETGIDLDRDDWGLAGLEPERFSKQDIKGMIKRIPDIPEFRERKKQLRRQAAKAKTPQARTAVGKLLKAFFQVIEARAVNQRVALQEKLLQDTLTSGVGLHADSFLRSLFAMTFADRASVTETFAGEDLAKGLVRVEEMTRIFRGLAPFAKEHSEKVYSLREERDHYYNTDDFHTWRESLAQPMPQLLNKAWVHFNPGVIYHFSSDNDFPNASVHPKRLSSSFVVRNTHHALNPGAKAPGKTLYQFTTTAPEQGSDFAENTVLFFFANWSEQGKLHGLLSGTMTLDLDSGKQPIIKSFTANAGPPLEGPFKGLSHAALLQATLPVEAVHALGADYVLPLYFAYKVDMVVNKKKRTRKTAKPDDPELDPEQEDDQEQEIEGKSGVDFKLVRAIRLIRPKQDKKNRKGVSGVWQEPDHQVPVEGFWRKLKRPTAWGHDAEGKPIMGKTWVTGHIRWNEKPKAERQILVKENVAAAEKRAKAGKI